MEARAIVIVYNGNQISEKLAIKFAQLLQKNGITSEENLSISILDSNDIAASLVRAKEDNTILFKKVKEEKTPVEHSLVYVSEYFGKEVWRNPVLFGVHLASMKPQFSSEMKTALRIICRDGVSKDLSTKYDFTHLHETAIEAVVKTM